MIHSICVLAPGYPSKEKPYEFTFIDQLVCAIADKGIDIYVITPYDALKARSSRIRIEKRKTQGGNTVKVYRPAVLTLSTRKIAGINIGVFSEILFKKAATDVIKRYQLKPDLIYAHFLFKAGTSAASIGEKKGIPSVCAFGESSLWSIREIGIQRAAEKLSSIDGVIAVSTNNKDVLVKNNIVPKEKIVVIPNAVNKQVFNPGSKEDARLRLGLPLNCVIGIYNGAFNESKGSLRVAKAAQGIDNLHMVYLGGGKCEPQGENILYKGRVPHEKVALWLRAADFFVLPTLEEGCCNAVIEAMSVGLPIITSDKPFNYDILDNESALLVNPLSINEIHTAMKTLTESVELRSKLGNASLKKAEKLDITDRAERIINYLNIIMDSTNM